MDEKRMFSRSKRQKPPDEGCWDCSVCTYKNSPEAYKCEMCDVRKGTSTRKPRLNSQLVAQQVAQQFVPPPPKKERMENGLLGEGEEEEVEEEEQEEEEEGEEGEEEGHDSPQDEYSFEVALPPPILETTNLSTISIKKEKNHTNTAKKNSSKQRSSKLRNIDRSSAREISVTVGSVTVTITDYQPTRERKTSTETSSNVTLDSFDNSSSSSGVSNDPKIFAEIKM